MGVATGCVDIHDYHETNRVPAFEGMTGDCPPGGGGFSDSALRCDHVLHDPPFFPGHFLDTISPGEE